MKIAVFIDFDNVEIGVKNTIGGQFDIGLVLEAIKERGEIVTKIAYSDWKRVGDYSRLLTQHAIRMVQRNMTPGGDKNGADITMALDALEMAFTHDHINAFVIVGGDSDFISLVEKLKQYDRKVFVVGGRQFTSATMQKNCHEFIAYENLVGSSRSHRQSGRGGARPPAAVGGIEKVLPLVRRALKVLSEREVTPQLGLLKSTLLQLDSTFSEREYGAGSFRDFMEKVAQAGAVTLKHAGRSLLVEAVEDGGEIGDMAPVAAMAPEAGPAGEAGDVAAPVAIPADGAESDLPPMVATMTNVEGIQALEQALASGNPRWPMYIRQMKQFLRNNIENFDERRYGFTSPVELLRAAQKEGLVRLERDRQGVMRVFAGAGQRQPVMAGEPVLDGEVSGQPVDAEPSGNEWVSRVTTSTQVEVSELSFENEPLERQPMMDVVADEPIVELADGEEPPDSQEHFLAAIEESLKAPVTPTRARKGSPRGRSAKPAGRTSTAGTARAAAVAKQRVRRPAARKKTS
ncbi:MAG: NYN domain-containing protein [Vicinamibacterales bacterium]|nr:NYN domain-containing protein [Vicinamibacterales bacterium]